MDVNNKILFIFVLFFSLVLSLSYNVAASSINILYPAQYTVIQRDNAATGDIPIVGNYSGNTTSIEASFNNGSWVTISTNPANGSFSGVLANQSVGQGNLTVRFSDNISINNTQTYVAIGDLIVFAGASNTDGQGTSPQLLNNSNMYLATTYRRDHAWKIANDPVYTTTNIGSYAPLVANYIIQRAHVPVGFIAGAVSGDTITDWNGTGTGNGHYNDTITLIREATNGTMKVKTIIYHAGGNEAATNMSYNTSKAAHANMANSFIRDTNVATEVLIIEKESRLTVARDNLDAIKKSQVDLWYENENVSYGANIYDVPVGADQIHFNTNASLATVAQRIWASLNAHYYNTSYNGIGPIISNITYVNSTYLILSFTNGTFPLTPSSGLKGFFIQNGTANFTDSNISSAFVIGTNQVGIYLSGSARISALALVSYASGNDAYNTTVIKDGGEFNLPVRSFWNHPMSNASNTSSPQNVVAPTIHAIVVSDGDTFYSFASGNNVIHAFVQISGQYNGTSPTNFSIIQFNFTNISSTCGTYGAIQNATLLMNGTYTGYYSANCTVITEAATSLFIVRNISVMATNIGNASDMTTYNTTIESGGIVLYNFTTPSTNDISGCMRFGALTTDLSTVQNFWNVTYVVEVDVNKSCWNMPNATGQYEELALINFTNIDLSNPTEAAKLANLYSAVNVTFNLPDTFGSSRVYINSSYLNSLNSSAIVKLFNIPFDSQPNIIQEVSGSLNSTSTLNWTQGVGMGNLTFTVNHFSGFNITDNTSPIITLNSPIAFNSTQVLMSITLNGTGTDISSALILFDSQLIANETNCTQRYVGSELFDCVFPYTISGLTNHNIVVITKDYGGPSPGNNAVLNQTVYYDTEAPIISLISPSNNLINKSGNITFSFNVTDNRDSILNCLFILSNGSTQQLYVANNTKYNYTTILSDGNYSWYVNCTDDAGNVNTTDARNVLIDNAGPTIIVSNLINSGYYGYNTLNFIINFSAIDNLAGVSSCRYRADNTYSINYTNCININITSNATDGNHSIIIYANDTLNNSVSVSYNYFVDTVFPNVTSGPAESSATITSFVISLTTTEPTNKTISYGGSLKKLDTTFNNVSSITLTSLNPGTPYSYTVTYCDRAGNCAITEERTFYTLDSSSGGGSTGGGSSGGGGGGGGAGSDTTGTADYSWSMIYDTLPNGTETVDVSNNDVLVSSIDLTTLVASYSINFDIERSNTSTTPYSPMISSGNELVFGYVSIDHANLQDSAISSAIIKFKVEKSWLNYNNVKKENVTLLRYANSTWNAIPSKVLREDTSYVYYQGTSPGLSLYVITGKKSPTINVSANTNLTANITTNTTRSNTTLGSKTISKNVTKSANTSGLSDIQSQDQAGSAGVWVWVIIFVIIVGVLGVFMYIKKMKQDKAASNSTNDPSQEQQSTQSQPVQSTQSMQSAQPAQQYNYARAPTQPQFNQQQTYGKQTMNQQQQGRPQQQGKLQQQPTRPQQPTQSTQFTQPMQKGSQPQFNQPQAYNRQTASQQQPNSSTNGAAPVTQQRSNQPSYRNFNYNYNTNYSRNINTSKKQASNTKK